MNKQKLASGSIKGTTHRVFVTDHDELGLLLEKGDKPLSGPDREGNTNKKRTLYNKLLLADNVLV